MLSGTFWLTWIKLLARGGPWTHIQEQQCITLKMCWKETILVVSNSNLGWIFVLSPELQNIQLLQTFGAVMNCFSLFPLV
jgi:hypothetical protein